MFLVAHNYQSKLEVSCDDFSGPSLPPGGSSSVSVNRVTLRVPPPRPTTMDPKPWSIRILFYLHSCDFWNWRSSHAYRNTRWKRARLNLFECHFIRNTWKTEIYIYVGQWNFCIEIQMPLYKLFWSFVPSQPIFNLDFFLVPSVVMHKFTCHKINRRFLSLLRVSSNGDRSSIS